jgi:hypothetical protein
VTEQDVLLRGRALTIGSAEADEQQRTVTDLSGVLANKVGKDLTKDDIFLAMSTGWALEDSGNHQLAASAFGQFAEAISASNDERFSQQAKTWRGIAKRLGLVGTRLELDGSLADGTALNWDAYRGKVVLVEFWPTWCSTDELTVVKRNYELYRDRGFDVVICNIGAEDDSLAEFLDDEDVPWVAVHTMSSSGDRNSPVYGAGQLPTSILIDRQGKVVSLEARGPHLNQLLEHLIGPLYDPQGKLYSVDLQQKANVKLAEGNPLNPDNNLEELRVGEQTLGGVKFSIGERLIQLASTEFPGRPEKVEGIRVNRQLKKLFILHATQFGTNGEVVDGTEIANYLVRYEDGSVEKIAVVYGVDVRDFWNHDDSRPVTRGHVVWEGENTASEDLGLTLRLYVTAWENPHPDMTVTSIDYVSTNTTAAAPFCVALTTEER